MGKSTGIANSLGVGRELKVRRVARKCLSLLNRLLARDGEVGGAAEPHTDPTARCWRQDDAHAIPDRALLPEGLVSNMGCEAGKYAKVTLGTRRLQGEPVYKVSLRLHRFACWLGKGDMPTEPATGKVWNMVTHQCSLKHCLALAHLEWGTASSNRVEHLLQANWKLEEQGKPRNKKRWVGPGTGFPAAVKPYQLFRCRGGS